MSKSKYWNMIDLHSHTINGKSYDNKAKAIQQIEIAQQEKIKQDVINETNGTSGFLTIQEISEIVIKQLYYDVWDGKLPTVITDGSGIIIQP